MDKLNEMKEGMDKDEMEHMYSVFEFCVTNVYLNGEEYFTARDKTKYKSKQLVIDYNNKKMIWNLMEKAYNMDKSITNLKKKVKKLEEKELVVEKQIKELLDRVKTLEDKDNIIALEKENTKLKKFKESYVSSRIYNTAFEPSSSSSSDEEQQE
tara:strand:+ start:1464 stop:1925 length:462 start_codon:yes stop_codon:yes gene_type:complete